MLPKKNGEQSQKIIKKENFTFDFGVRLVLLMWRYVKSEPL